MFFIGKYSKFIYIFVHRQADNRAEPQRGEDGFEQGATEERPAGHSGGVAARWQTLEIVPELLPERRLREILLNIQLEPRVNFSSLVSCNQICHFVI